MSHDMNPRDEDPHAECAHEIDSLTTQLTASRARAERLAAECKAWRKVSEIQAQRDDDESRYADSGQTYSWGDLAAATSSACRARAAVDSHKDLETPNA